MLSSRIVSRLVYGADHRAREMKARTVLAVVLIGWGLLGFFAKGRAEEAVAMVTFSRLAGAPLTLPAADEARAVWAQRLPEGVRAIDGRMIEITGYMLPLKMQGGRVTDFLLMRDQAACCYGKMPGANEYLVAQASAGGLVAAMDIPVTVRGRLRIAPEGIEGAFYQFYTLGNTTTVSVR